MNLIQDVETAVRERYGQGALATEPYREHFDFVEPREPVALDEAGPFDCSRTPLRHPRETKGLDHDVTTEATEPCCGPDGCC